MGRWAKLALGGGALVGAAGLLIALILYLWPPAPVDLVLIGSGYQNNLAVPHNAHG